MSIGVCLLDLGISASLLGKLLQLGIISCTLLRKSIEIALELIRL